jgi:DNA mismatch repair ATPase MutL
LAHLKSIAKTFDADEYPGCDEDDLKRKSRHVSSLNPSLSVKLNEQDLAKFKVIRQVDDKYIVGTIPYDGDKRLLVIFDQHAVHERIRLEGLVDGIRQSKIISSCHQLFIGVGNLEVSNVLMNIESSPQQLSVFASRSLDLAQLGYAFKQSSRPKSAAITVVKQAKVLEGLSAKESKTLFIDCLLDLENGRYGWSQTPFSFFEALKSGACHGNTSQSVDLTKRA